MILTSSREEQDIGASYTSGANAYVVKPLDFVEFGRAIKQLGIFQMMLNKPSSGSVQASSNRERSPLFVMMRALPKPSVAHPRLSKVVSHLLRPRSV